MRIGIDLGGTKIEGIALNGHGVEQARIRIPTPRNDYGAIVQAVASVVETLEASVGERATVGIGIPGMLSPTTGVVKNANTVCLIGRPLQKDLESRLSRSVRIENDANCFALSEATDGAGVPVTRKGHVPYVVFGVILGTGTGGSIVVEGNVHLGTNRIAGEWGHNPLPWPSVDELPGPACYCGKSGCIETFLSGPGLARDHLAHTGEHLEPVEIAVRANAGNPAAEATLDRYEHRLARSLATVLNVLDPDVVVLGGGLSNILRLYTRVPTLWKRYVFSDTVLTRLERARHGDSSGVRGAAWLWPA